MGTAWWVVGEVAGCGAWWGKGAVVLAVVVVVAVVALATGVVPTFVTWSSACYNGTCVAVCVVWGVV